MPQAPIESIQPIDNSLAAHLQALDLLSSRISSLSDQTRWSARIPLNSKATIRGQITNTNDLKVHVGAGYYVEMTSVEAAEYVQRRKNALLLQHAGLKENTQITTSSIPVSDIGLPAPVSFNPLFSMPSVAGPSRRQRERSESTGEKDLPSSDAQLPTFKGKERQITTEEVDAEAGIGKNTDKVVDADEPQSLMDVVEKFLEIQQGLSNVSEDQKDRLKGDKSDDALITEDGLPIHEIREDFDGKLIGTAPNPTTNGEPVVEVSDDIDYWSEEAKARRESLRRKIFSEDDSDLESDEDGVFESASKTSTVPEGAKIEEIEEMDEQPSSPITRRSSSTAPPPSRSILKPPTRKKSVTFDESIPLPPDSPPTNPTKMGSPLPISEFEPRPIPVIATPKPTSRTNNTDTFAGFKRGFLSGSTSSIAAPVHTSSPVPADPTPKAKGPSKFAQAMAAKKSSQAEQAIPEVELDPTPPAIKDEVKERPITDVPKPPRQIENMAIRGALVERSASMAGLPKFSETKPMGTMLNAVVERETVPPVVTTSSSPHTHPEDGDGEDEDDDCDDYDEEDEEEDDEDEYDLDEALLAREVALDYHRRQGYITKYTREVDSDGEEQEPGEYQVNSDGELEGHGGVVMGLPQISANGEIINPTPDDIRKYIRVGRLENGNLVLAPGEEGWSSDEDPEKKAKRDAVRRQLLGDDPFPPSNSSQIQQPEQTSLSEMDLPPTLATDVKETKTDPKPVVKSVGEVVERTQPVAAPVEPAPKKVSRFKAARMGM